MGRALRFPPDLPRHALAQGADALVTSAHKTLPAYSQAALVLARTERLDADRLERAVEATQTTSPAGAILASIDAARALLARDGRALPGGWSRTRGTPATASPRSTELVVLDGPGVDPAKLVVLLRGHGCGRQSRSSGTWPTPACRWRWPTATAWCRC